MKPFICIDFDGVLNNYDHYDENDLSTPKHGAKEFLEKLSREFTIIILSARKYPKIVRWLEQHDMIQYVADVTSVKPPARVYLDDRGIQFKGDYEKALKDIKNFKTYWEVKEDE